MENYIIKLKKRGTRYFKEYDIVVFKQTASPNKAPLAKIGKYKPKIIGKNYAVFVYSSNVLNYWLTKGAKIQKHLLKLLLLY